MSWYDKFDLRTAFKSALRALEITVFIAGSFHITLVALAAAAARDLSFINPVAFLGIDTVYPGVQANDTVFVLSWAVLILLYLGVLALSVSKGLKLKFVFQTIRTHSNEVKVRLQKIASTKITTRRSE